jgi:hypothetical protein
LNNFKIYDLAAVGGTSIGTPQDVTLNAPIDNKKKTFKKVKI